MTTKNPADRQALAARVPRAHLEMLDRVRGTCRSLSQENRTIREWLENKQVEALGVGKAGRLANGFRNYLFHGDEAPPEPDDWDDRYRTALDGDESVSLHSYRLVSFTRLTLHLIQTLMHAELRPGTTMEATDVPFLSRGVDAEFDLPYGFVLNLATCWPEERGLALSWKAIAELANGCDVPPESLRHVEHYGAAPTHAAFDGGYASRENLRAAKALGVTHAVFHKKRGMKAADMTPSA